MRPGGQYSGETLGIQKREPGWGELSSAGLPTGHVLYCKGSQVARTGGQSTACIVVPYLGRSIQRSEPARWHGIILRPVGFHLTPQAPRD
jgi:hypothetical protein